MCADAVPSLWGFAAKAITFTFLWVEVDKGTRSYTTHAHVCHVCCSCATSNDWRRCIVPRYHSLCRSTLELRTQTKAHFFPLFSLRQSLCYLRTNAIAAICTVYQTLKFTQIFTRYDKEMETKGSEKYSNAKCKSKPTQNRVNRYAIIEWHPIISASFIVMRTRDILSHSVNFDFLCDQFKRKCSNATVIRFA